MRKHESRSVQVRNAIQEDAWGQDLVRRVEWAQEVRKGMKAAGARALILFYARLLS